MFLLIRMVVLEVLRWLKRSIAKGSRGSDNEDKHKAAKRHKKIKRYFRDSNSNSGSASSDGSDFGTDSNSSDTHGSASNLKAVGKRHPEVVREVGRKLVVLLKLSISTMLIRSTRKT